MAQKQAYNFREYKALSHKLRRLNIKHSGRVASLLLGCFVRGNGQLFAKEVVIAGICEEGQFNLWRDELVRRGVLIWSGQDLCQWSRHTPGKEIVEYINREKFRTDELATKIDLTEFVTKAEMKRVVAHIIEKLDPPATEDKVQAYINPK